MPDPLDLWQLPFARTALAELLLLAGAAGLAGAWVVLRRRAFFAHAAGAATFPGLVLAAAAGFAAPVAALAAALAYALAVAALERGAGGEDPHGPAGDGRGQAATGLLLVTALAAGVVLASDVFGSGAEVDRLLFGTLLGLGAGDLAVAAAAALLAAAASVVFGRTWTAIGFDGGGGGLPLEPALAEALLLSLVAVVAVAALPAVGALLATTLLIVPAATARLLTGSVPALLTATPLVAAVEGLAALYLALWIDAPPGPVLAVLGGLVYLAVSAAQHRPLRATAKAHP